MRLCWGSPMIITVIGTWLASSWTGQPVLELVCRFQNQAAKLSGSGTELSSQSGWNISTGLQYAHAMLYQRMTSASGACSSPCNFKQHKECLRQHSSRSICWKSICTWSFQVTGVSMHKWLIEKRLRCVFGATACYSCLTSSSNRENRHLW